MNIFLFFFSLVCLPLGAHGLRLSYNPLMLIPGVGHYPFYSHPQYQKLQNLALHYKKHQSQTTPLSKEALNQGPQGLLSLARCLVRHHFLAPTQTFSKPQVIQALKDFQKAYRLKPTGTLTPATLSKLNQSLEDLMELVEINLQRFSTIRRFHAKHLIVNLPSFTLYAFDQNQEIFSSPVVIGKTETPTPQFSGALTAVVTNPPWIIPSDQVNKLKGNVGSRGYAWSGSHLIQKPGPHNPLGPLKFLVRGGEGAIILHGTNKPHLFQKPQRAYSLGCIRVQELMKLAQFALPEALFETLPKALDKKQTRHIQLPEEIDLHVLYLTVWVDEKNHPQFYEDIYELEEFEEEEEGES